MEDVCTTYCPELDEVLHHSGADHCTVDGGVGQKQHKVLVVGEADAVVHPGWSKQQQMVSKIKSSLLKLFIDFKCKSILKALNEEKGTRGSDGPSSAHTCNKSRKCSPVQVGHTD